MRRGGRGEEGLSVSRQRVVRRALGRRPIWLRPDVVYLESHVGALYLQEAAEVEEYRRIFDLISKDAIPVEEYR